MADYTDIDKLRELAESDDYAEFGSETVLALTAELVGLRTEVDQLRTDNERLREFIMAEREACSFDGPLPTGSWPDVALQLIRQLLGQRDALQARIDAATTAAERWACDHDGFDEVLAALGVDPQT